MSIKGETVLVLALGLAAVILMGRAPRGENSKWQEWKISYGMRWQGSEDEYRRAVFMQNIEIIEAHNADSRHNYRMAVNQFTAYTDQEFRELFLNPLSHQIKSQQLEPLHQETIIEQDEVDWTAKGMVSPVKNQGHCGSCWAFSAVAVLQSHALFNGQKVDLSEQQLVDCSHLYGNMGCNGGFNYQGLAYVRDHGITSTAKYPYIAKNQKCQIHGGDYKIKHFQTTIGCNGLISALQKAPVGIGVDAQNWARYGSGIFDNCGKHLDHNVLLVGLTKDYYRIKNSWAATWGEKGFIRLARGNTCGICQGPSPYLHPPTAKL